MGESDWILIRKRTKDNRKATYGIDGLNISVGRGGDFFIEGLAGTPTAALDIVDDLFRLCFEEVWITILDEGDGLVGDTVRLDGQRRETDLDRLGELVCGGGETFCRGIGGTGIWI
jgi:hypothetical protein